MTGVADTMPTAMLAACRLCSGASREQFRRPVLGRYDVGYALCDVCGSLQTEPPTWLAEAYTDHGSAAATVSNLNSLDTGAAYRNQETLAVTMTVAGMFGLHDVMDVGGGDGLLCRMLRDHGLNAFVVDAYARPTYAQGFTVPDFARPDLLTAFEVFEHFAAPRDEIDRLFADRPRVVLISTTPYAGQGPDWPYLIPGTGQHVFFYGEAAFWLIAARAGYEVFRAGNYTAFFSPGLLTPLRRRLLRFRLRGRVLRLYRMVLSGRRTDGHLRDAERIAARQP